MSDFWWTNKDTEDGWKNGGYDTREEALAAGRAEYPGKTIYTGRFIQSNVFDMMPDAGDIVEHMQNQAYDYGDRDGEWLSYVLAEEDKELTEKIQTVIFKWLKKYKNIPKFGLIDLVQEHTPEE